MEHTMALPMMQAFAVLGVIALAGFALQAFWILVLQPLFRWLGNL